MLRGICLAAIVCLCALAEMRMTVAQLRAFIRSSVQLGHPDRRVADYVKQIKLLERLDESTVEDLQGQGAGPKTVEALKQIAALSRTLPAPPPPKAPAPALPPPSEAEQQQVLKDVTDYARDYVKRLPNFICTQVTRRFADPSGLEFWQRQDVLTARLSYFEQKEDYKVILVNDRSVDTSFESLGGATSTGEFGSMLREIFDSKSRARFEWQRWATLRGRRMHVYAYRIAQPNSKWSLVYEKRDAIQPGYHGLIYVDRETLAVMRVTLEAENVPPAFPIQLATTTLDYDFVEIAGTQHVLPLKAVMRMRSGKLLIKNEVEFRMYKRFGAEATITFTPDPLPEEQTKETK